MNKPKYILYAFSRALSFAIIKVAVVGIDRGNNCIVVPIDGDGKFNNIPFDAWTVRRYEVYNTQKEALMALQDKVRMTAANINDFLEHRVIDGSNPQLHIPNDSLPYPLSY